MNYEKIKQELIKKHEEVKVVNYINYITKLKTDAYFNGAQKGKLKNPWMGFRDEKYFIDIFNKIAEEKLYIDGEIILINAHGVSFTAQAYKNLVLIRYPETKFDLQLVKEQDEFSCIKKDGKIFYNHKIGDPFKEGKVVGGYCVIKNKLGEFIETISLEELNKIRKTAKTDDIWATWTNEMYLKSIIKRACKRHFKDVVVNVEQIDNETNYEITNPLDIELETKQEIEAIKTLDDLQKYYLEHKDTIEFPKSFNTLVCKKKKELSKEDGVA